MSSQSRHSARTVRTKRSAIAFAFGARTGVRMISMKKSTQSGCSQTVSTVKKSTAKCRAPARAGTRAKERPARSLAGLSPRS
jgi:hypothetical protein